MTRLLFMSDYFQVSLDYLMRGTGKEGHLTKSNSAVPETTPEQKEALQQELLRSEERLPLHSEKMCKLTWGRSEEGYVDF